MTSRLHTRLPYLFLLVVAAAACGRDAQARTTPPEPGGTIAPAPPSISIQSPTSGEAVQGVTIIRFRTENVSITSPFLPPGEHRGPLPAAHLHVTVDGTAWHWVHATSDPVVVTPLPPGEHSVELELAGADHRPLASQTVRFTVVPKTAPTIHYSAHP